MYNNPKKEKQIVEEVAVAYGKVFDSRMTIIQSIKQGVSFKLFTYIKNRCPFSDEEWAKFLGISTKSLQRYALTKNHIFKPLHSEIVLEIAEVCDAGMEVFNDKDDLYNWLVTESFAFEYMIPIELMDTSYGKQLIKEQFHRYAHGIFA